MRKYSASAQRNSACLKQRSTAGGGDSRAIAAGSVLPWRRTNPCGYNVRATCCGVVAFHTFSGGGDEDHAAAVAGREAR
eukprot:1554720-Lingulodinium_polyedra.AAC.1